MTKDVDLACALAEAGLPLIAVHKPAEPDAVPRSVRELVLELGESGDALFRGALVPLILSNADAAREAARAGRSSNMIAGLYTAAVCLQRLWRTRLELHGRRHELPDVFSRDLNLPDPNVNYGRACFHELCARFAQESFRGADVLLAKLVEQMFEILSREAYAATR